MAQSARTFRIFVSSTFSDLKAERNALQERVYPRLRDLAATRGCRFQVVDLRWGISEEAALDQKTMKICLSEIERCQKVSPRPNFIILLGNRYGWCPLPYQIACDEFGALLANIPRADHSLLLAWYKQDDNAVPPVRILQPRQGEYKDSASWEPVERQLHLLLENAAKKANIPEANLFKYLTSATEQEIIQGALQVVDAGEHVFCFTREVAGLPQDESAQVFIDLEKNKPNTQADKQLSSLKRRLRDRLGKNYHEYQARWKNGGSSADHLDRLCEDVFTSLAHIIQEETRRPQTTTLADDIALYIKTNAALDAEGLAQHIFAEEHLRFFVGRTEMLAIIADYLKEDTRHSLAIVGAGGSGKSALVAKAIQQTQVLFPNAEVVYRFIGATPGSSDGRTLLASLCREISRRYGVDEGDVPNDYGRLSIELGKRMQLASADRPLVLFLDSLDQISIIQNARAMVWLPNELPQHAFVVVSTREGEPLNALQMKQTRVQRLGGLSPQEGDDLLSQWLASIHRTLQNAQRQEVQGKFAQSQRNPLYLKLAFEEARLWTSDQPPEQLAIDIKGIIEKNMINRLGKDDNHGEMLVAHALGYLAVSRYGLMEDELVDLLSRDPQVYGWFIRKSFHFPSDLVQSATQYRQSLSSEGNKKKMIRSTEEEEEYSQAWLDETRESPQKMAEFLGEVLPRLDGPRLPGVFWSRLSADLAPYMNERMVDGNMLLNFYHRELGEIASTIFLTGGEDKSYHERLADYFRLKADPEANRSWTGNDPHSLSEIPYHLINSARYQEAFEILTDFKFLEKKASTVGVEEYRNEKGNPIKIYTGVLQLQEDYELALEIMPGKGAAGSATRPPLIVTAMNSDKGLTIYCPVCNKTSPIKTNMLGTIISCPQESCQTPLKINLSIIE